MRSLKYIADRHRCTSGDYRVYRISPRIDQIIFQDKRMLVYEKTFPLLQSLLVASLPPTLIVNHVQVWFPTDRDMVGCDSCSFWVHASCDRLAAKALSAAEQMDFHCRQCRRVRNFNNRLAALQQAQHALRIAEPRHPRSAFGLFATEIQR